MYCNPIIRLNQQIEALRLTQGEYIIYKLEKWSMTHYCEYWMKVTNEPLDACLKLYNKGQLKGMVKAELDKKRKIAPQIQIKIKELYEKRNIYTYIDMPNISTIHLNYSLSIHRQELAVLNMAFILAFYETGTLSCLPKDVHEIIFSFTIYRNWFEDEVKWHKYKIDRIRRKLHYILKGW
jgi:hypothetical protein